MSDTHTLKVFHNICSFVKELHEQFGKKYYNVTLYNRILEKTPITHNIGILKHIQIFSEFLRKNNEAIVSNDVSKLVWDTIRFEKSKKIYINIKEILENADDENKTTIWKYLLTISYSINPSDELRNKIADVLKGNENNDNEIKFVEGFMSKIEDTFKNKNFSDPMSATTELLQSGIFNDLVTTMNSDIQNKKINVNKLLGTVQGMIGNLSSEVGSMGDNTSGPLPDINGMLNMVNGMMSSMQNPNESSDEQKDLPNINPDMINNVMSMLGNSGEEMNPMSMLSSLGSSNGMNPMSMLSNMMGGMMGGNNNQDMNSFLNALENVKAPEVTEVTEESNVEKVD